MACLSRWHRAAVNCLSHFVRATSEAVGATVRAACLNLCVVGRLPSRYAIRHCRPHRCLRPAKWRWPSTGGRPQSAARPDAVWCGENFQNSRRGATFSAHLPHIIRIRIMTPGDFPPVVGVLVRSGSRRRVSLATSYAAGATFGRCPPSEVMPCELWQGQRSRSWKRRLPHFCPPRIGRGL